MANGAAQSVLFLGQLDRLFAFGTNEDLEEFLGNWHRQILAEISLALGLHIDRNPSLAGVIRDPYSFLRVYGEIPLTR